MDLELISKLLMTLVFAQGMTGPMQSEAVAWFKAPGRKILVATNAAEEGLDVAACELVVRYSVTITGEEFPQTINLSNNYCFIFCLHVLSD